MGRDVRRRGRDREAGDVEFDLVDPEDLQILGIQRFTEGDVVMVRACATTMLRLPTAFWHVRFVQEDLAPAGGIATWRCYCQALPIGTWPATFSWLPEDVLRSTGLCAPVATFEEQDRWFREAGRGTQLQARRERGYGHPLPQELEVTALMGEVV